MNSNKIINLVNFYQSIGIEYLIDSIDIKSLQKEQEKNNLKITKKTEPSLASTFAKKDLKSNTLKNIFPKKNIEEITLDHITNLVNLKEELLKFEGCSLKKTAINTVFGCGDENSNIMLIGEAPGAEEDEKGEPFVGRSGKLLMRALESIGLSRDKLFITNTIFWRPPGNRNPTIEEMQQCYPFLKRIIELVEPKILIIVGKVATSNLMKENEPIGKMRGKWSNIEVGHNKYESRIVFHPSYLLRSSSQKKLLWLDLLEIKDKIKSLGIE